MHAVAGFLDSFWTETVRVLAADPMCGVLVGMISTATSHYVVSASAPGAWCSRLQVPLDSYDEVCAAFEFAARTLDLPISAAVRGNTGDVVELLLLRDPSCQFGTPSIPRYEQLAETLMVATGWRRRDLGLGPGIVVPLGLRRGYAFDAPVHNAGDVRRLLAARAPGSRSRPARLCSVRVLPNGDVQWHHGPGLLVHLGPSQAHILADLAAELGQHRFVITGDGVTTAFRHRGHAQATGSA